MAVLSQLRLAHKFLVLGVVAVLVAAIPAHMFFRDQWAQLQTAQQEARASDMVIALDRLVQFAQVHRGLSAAALAGNQTLGARRLSIGEQVRQWVAVLDQSIGRASVSDGLRTQWLELKQHWVDVEEHVSKANISAAESTRLHTQIIRGLLILNEHILAESGLSLDPDTDAYFLIETALVDVPELAENLGVLRVLGTGFLTQSMLPPEGRAVLQVMASRTAQVKEGLLRNLRRAAEANPEIQTLMHASADASLAAVDNALVLLDKELISTSAVTYPAPAYFDSFTQTIDGLYTFNGAAMREMSSILDARVQRLKTSMAIVSAELLLGLGLAFVVSLLFMRSITHPLLEAVTVAKTVASGNLTVDIPVTGSNELSQLMRALASMREQLASLVVNVRSSAYSVATASAEISMGNTDLSVRTESQASILAQTVSAMDDLGDTIHHNASAAMTAHQLAADASHVAQLGGSVVEQVVDTMSGITTSSRKISSIISVIDGIAFQTNILALNAAVEAARAGEQGRGFAVVATEVRSLASRSADAAKEIASLIKVSVARVEQGELLVAKAGETMAAVVASTQKVAALIGEISASSERQSAGMSHIGQAVGRIDTVTQQNAALVEQMAAAASSLKKQADELVGAISVFRVPGALVL